MNNRCRYLSLRLVNAFLASTIAWSFSRALPWVLSKHANVQKSFEYLASLSVWKSPEHMCDRDGMLEFFAPRDETAEQLPNEILVAASCDPETMKSKEAVRRQIANRVYQQIRLN